MNISKLVGQASPLSPSPKKARALWPHVLRYLPLLVALSAAADYSITWHKVAGGGGTSTNGQYSVSGTIGQADANGATTNSQYSITGGFWAVTLVQTPGAPTLHLTNAAPGFATLWWTPPTTGYVLQSTDGLSPTNWMNAPSGTNNPAAVPTPAPASFYRLFKP